MLPAAIVKPHVYATAWVMWWLVAHCGVQLRASRLYTTPASSRTCNLKHIQNFNPKEIKDSSIKKAYRYTQAYHLSKHPFPYPKVLNRSGPTHLRNEGCFSTKRWKRKINRLFPIFVKKISILKSLTWFKKKF